MPLHPIHAMLLGFPLPLFLGALLSDMAYRTTFHIQWANFAAWLIAGALVFGAIVLVWALVDVFRHGPVGRTKRLVHFAVLLVMCIVGVVSALVHAKDAWATMPEGLYLSAISTLLAAVAAWMGYARFQHRELA
jgi:uncharacterized membrane protein